MKTHSTSISQFFDNCGQYKNMAIEIDNLILETSPNIDRKLHNTDNTTILGYAFAPYKNSCYDGFWPIISIAPQKNNLSLYFMLFENGNSVVKQYAHIFGKSNVGVSCIRLKKLNEEKLDAIRELVSKVKVEPIK